MLGSMKKHMHHRMPDQVNIGSSFIRDSFDGTGQIFFLNGYEERAHFLLLLLPIRLERSQSRKCLFIQVSEWFTSLPASAPIALGTQRVNKRRSQTPLRGKACLCELLIA